MNPTRQFLTLASLAFLLSAGVTPEVLAHGDGLEEIVVTSSRTNRTLDDTPLRVQILNEEELREKANMKPGDIRMLLNESTGIQVQQTSATSFNSSIRIQALDGRYTQLLRDGLPIYSGFSGSLSLLQITPLDLAQVEVIKGASSTLYGGGAIAGLVNLISRTPGHTPETAVMINGTSASGLDLSAFHAREEGRHGVTLFATYNRNDAYDPADNGLTAIPEFERFTLAPRWFYELSEQTELDLGIGFIKEDRLGGSTDYLDGDQPGDYFESNDTRRAYTRLGLRHHFDHDVEFALKSAYSWFDRSLSIPGHQFSGVQASSFTELTLNGDGNRSSWVGGLNFLTEDFDQDQNVSGFNHDYDEHTVGLFGQYTYDLSDTVVLEAGLRADRHSDYGNFLLPRISIMFLPLPDTTIRLGGGLGYKAPGLFVSEAEGIHFRNLVPLNSSNFDAETSRGINFDINHRLELDEHFSLTSNLLLFYTEIEDAVRLNETAGVSFFTQDAGNISTRGLELNLIFDFGEVRYFLGYTHANAREDRPARNEPLPLVSRHRVNNVLVWEREDNFRIGLEAYYFSPQRRPGDSKGKPYWIYGLMMEKRLNERVTGFLNFENFTDTRQTEFESINTGTLKNPVFREIYAPLDGFVVNGGVRIQW